MPSRLLTPTEKPRGPLEHIAPLDGLRAAAILLVLLFHLTPNDNANQGLRSLLWKLADIGWSGVDLFFVLSGFLITTKLLAARDDEHRFRDFYIRRALRIFPLYYLALVVALVLLPLFYDTLSFEPLGNQLPFWLYYMNFTWPVTQVESVAAISHFWSLAIEEQFYLVWPAIIFFCSARAARIVCIAVVIAAPMLRYLLADSGLPFGATYSWTPSRADGLVLGALLALVYASAALRHRVVPFSLAALAVSTPLVAWAAWRGKATLVVSNLMTADALLVRSLLPSAVSLLYAALLVLALEWRPLSRILSGPAQTALARYSYGIYVVHFMLYPTFERTLLPRVESPLLFFIIASTVSFAIAVLTYHGFEQFFLTLKPKRREASVAQARS